MSMDALPALRLSPSSLTLARLALRMDGDRIGTCIPTRPILNGAGCWIAAGQTSKPTGLIGPASCLRAGRRLMSANEGATTTTSQGGVQAHPRALETNPHSCYLPETGKSKQPGQPVCNQRARMHNRTWLAACRVRECRPKRPGAPLRLGAWRTWLQPRRTAIGYETASQVRCSISGGPEAGELADKIRPGDHRLIQWCRPC